MVFEFILFSQVFFLRLVGAKLLLYIDFIFFSFNKFLCGVY